MATWESRIKTVGSDVFLYSTYYNLLGNSFSHFLSVSVVKFGGEGFNIPGTSFLIYKNGPSPGRFF